MQESCTYVRGAPSNGCPYRNRGSDALLALRRELLSQKHRLLKQLTSPTPARLDVALLRGEVGRIRAVEGQC